MYNSCLAEHWGHEVDESLRTEPVVAGGLTAGAGGADTAHSGARCAILQPRCLGACDSQPGQGSKTTELSSLIKHSAYPAQNHALRAMQAQRLSTTVGRLEEYAGGHLQRWTRSLQKP